MMMGPISKYTVLLLAILVVQVWIIESRNIGLPQPYPTFTRNSNCLSCVLQRLTRSQTAATRRAATTASILNWIRGGSDCGNGETSDSDGASSGIVEKQADDIDNENGIFEIIGESVVYSRWRTVIQRKVRMKSKRPRGADKEGSTSKENKDGDSKIIDFDIIAQKDGIDAVIIFAYNTTSKTATVIREYMPACNRMMYGLAAGMLESSSKHSGDNPSLIAAKMELEEECHLIGGEWMQLTTTTSSGGGGTYMDKYSSTKVHAFLVIDAIPTDNPRPLDDEEYIEIIPSVSIEKIIELIRDNQFTITGGWACLVAINKLRELGLYN